LTVSTRPDTTIYRCKNCRQPHRLCLSLPVYTVKLPEGSKGDLSFLRKQKSSFLGHPHSPEAASLHSAVLSHSGERWVVRFGETVPKPVTCSPNARVYASCLRKQQSRLVPAEAGIQIALYRLRCPCWASRNSGIRCGFPLSQESHGAFSLPWERRAASFGGMGNVRVLPLPSERLPGGNAQPKHGQRESKQKHRFLKIM